MKRFSHLCCNRKTCNTESVQITDFGQSFHSSHQARLCANAQPTLHLRKYTIKTNELTINKQMTEPWQPTANHVSFGGQFEM